MSISYLESAMGVVGLQGKSPGDEPGSLDAKRRVLALLKSPCPKHSMKMTHW